MSTPRPRPPRRLRSPLGGICRQQNAVRNPALAIADLIVERAEEIALCECWDTGQALALHVQGRLARRRELSLSSPNKVSAARDGQQLRNRRR